MKFYEYFFFEMYSIHTLSSNAYISVRTCRIDMVESALESPNVTVAFR